MLQTTERCCKHGELHMGYGPWWPQAPGLSWVFKDIWKFRKIVTESRHQTRIGLIFKKMRPNIRQKISSAFGCPVRALPNFMGNRPT